MALMLTLDDAVKCLKDVRFRKIEDDDDYEWIRSVLEQKCYMISKAKSNTWFDETRQDIEYVTSPENIGMHIVEGDLKKWLEMCRDNIIAELTLAAGGKK